MSNSALARASGGRLRLRAMGIPLQTGIALVQENGLWQGSPSLMVWGFSKIAFAMVSHGDPAIY